MTGYFNRVSLYLLAGAVTAIVAFTALQMLYPAAVSWMVGETLSSTFLINIGIFFAVVVTGALLSRRSPGGRSKLGGLGAFLFGLGSMAVGLAIWRQFNAEVFQAQGAGQWAITMVGVVVLGLVIHVVGRWLRLND